MSEEVDYANEPDIRASIIKAGLSEEGDQLWRFTYKQPVRGGKRIQDYVAASSMKEAEERVAVLIDMWRETQRKKDSEGVTAMPDDKFGTTVIV